MGLATKGVVKIESLLMIGYLQKQLPEVFYIERCSKNFAKFTGKQLCQSLFFDKVASLRSATLLKKGLWHRCFPVNFAKFLRTPFLENTSGWLLLYPEEYLDSLISSQETCTCSKLPIETLEKSVKCVQT